MCVLECDTHMNPVCQLCKKKNIAFTAASAWGGGSLAGRLLLLRGHDVQGLPGRHSPGPPGPVMWLLRVLGVGLAALWHIWSHRLATCLPRPSWRHLGRSGPAAGVLGCGSMGRQVVCGFFLRALQVVGRSHTSSGAASWLAGAGAQRAAAGLYLVATALPTSSCCRSYRGPRLSRAVTCVGSRHF